MVLAAGRSERMSGDLPKQLLRVGDTTLAGLVVAAAEHSAFDRVVVVTGYRSREVEASLARTRAAVAHNPAFATGNMSSFRVGVEALGSCEAVAVVLADMPEVGASHLNRFAAAWHAESPSVAVASYSDGRGHPIMFAAHVLEAAAAMDDPNGLWRFIDASSSSEVLEVQFPLPKPGDINTPEEFQAFLTRRPSQAPDQS